jgi:hypothetical protein
MLQADVHITGFRWRSSTGLLMYVFVPQIEQGPIANRLPSGSDTKNLSAHR